MASNLNPESGAGKYPLAMKPPEGKVIRMNSAMIRSAAKASRESPRGRIILPLHKSEKETLHRMFNVIQPGSYVRPHRHLTPPKVESFIVVRGAICFVVFGSDGKIEQFHHLAAGSECFGIDVEPGIFHTFYALEEDSAVFEVKTGPYSPLSDKELPAWAPAESSASAAAYLKTLQRHCSNPEPGIPPGSPVPL